MQGIDKDNNGEHVPKLESFEVVVVHGIMVQVLCTFVPS